MNLSIYTYSQLNDLYAEGVIDSTEFFEEAKQYMSQKEIDAFLLEHKNRFDLKEEKLKKFEPKRIEAKIKSIIKECDSSGAFYEKFKHYGSQSLLDMLTPE